MADALLITNNSALIPEKYIMNRIVARSNPVCRQAGLRVKRIVILIEACPDNYLSSDRDCASIYISEQQFILT